MFHTKTHIHRQSQIVTISIKKLLYVFKKISPNMIRFDIMKSIITPSIWQAESCVAIIQEMNSMKVNGNAIKYYLKITVVWIHRSKPVTHSLPVECHFVTLKIKLIAVCFCSMPHVLISIGILINYIFAPGTCKCAVWFNEFSNFHRFKTFLLHY